MTSKEGSQQLKNTKIRIGDEYRNDHGEHFIVGEFRTTWGFKQFHPDEYFDEYNDMLQVIGKYGHDEGTKRMGYILLMQYELYSRGNGKEISVLAKDNPKGFIVAINGPYAKPEKREEQDDVLPIEKEKIEPCKPEPPKTDNKESVEQLSLF